MVYSSKNHDSEFVGVLLNSSLKANHPDLFVGYLRSYNEEG